MESALNPEQEAHLVEHSAVEVCYDIGDQGRYRGSVFIDRSGVNGVFRIIPNQVPTLKEVGLPEHLEVLSNWHQGLVLIVGPASSGKTTTLAALVNYLNDTRRAHIITIEDPIEYVHHFKNSLINQRQVGRDTEGYQRALRGALREDPDIIAVGDMRDAGVMRPALEAAETGHLVIATMNGTCASKAIDRIINAFPPEEQGQVRLVLADTIKLVIGQSLLPAADGGDRVGLFEVLMGCHTVSASIRDNRTRFLHDLMQTGRDLGMRTIDASLMELLKLKRISPATAHARAQNKPAFAVYLSGENQTIEAA